MISTHYLRPQLLKLSGLNEPKCWFTRGQNMKNRRFQFLHCLCKGKQKANRAAAVEGLKGSSES